MSTHLFKLQTRSLAGLLLALLLGSCGGSPVPDAEEETAVEMAIHYMKASNTDAGDWFGLATVLSADGNTLAVSAPWEDSDGNERNNAMDGSGAVYVFVRSGNAWVQQAYLKAHNGSPSDNFGWSAALSADGNVLAVGAPNEDSNNVNNPGDNSVQDAGAVYVFTRSGTAWTQRDYLKAGNIGAGDGFGTSTALAADGRTLAVGTPFENGDANSTSNAPNQLAPSSGAVYVFSFNQVGTWTQKSYLKASNAQGGSVFGTSVALSGDGHTLAAGAIYESSGDAGNQADTSLAEASNAIGFNGNQLDNSATEAGAAYVFARSGVNWRQLAYVKASNTRANSWFGYAMSLSGDGQTLAVGAPRENSKGDPSDTSAAEAGAAYVVSVPN